MRKYYTLKYSGYEVKAIFNIFLFISPILQPPSSPQKYVVIAKYFTCLYCNLFDLFAFSATLQLIPSIQLTTFSIIVWLEIEFFVVVP